MKQSSLLIALILTFQLMAQSQDARPKLKVATNYGDMVVELYNETPQHRDNFLKLVEEGFYDSLQFHRIIKNFMIQGGDPGSRGAKGDKQLGSGGPGYTIEAEITPQFIHKKGALSAARQGDQVNPDRRSSGSQFYIVQGQVTNIDQLAQFEQRCGFDMKQQQLRKFFMAPENKEYLDRYQAAANVQDQAAVQEIMTEVQPIIDATNSTGVFAYTPEQRKAYATIGGTPHLDQQYTVFGEVIEGLNIIDSIAAVPTKPGDTPVEPVIMNISILEK
jgi:peptidylprolyl isomerase